MRHNAHGLVATPPNQTSTGLPAFIDRATFAREAGLSRSTIERMIAAGKLKTFLDGRRIVIATKQLERVAELFAAKERAHG